MKLSRIVPGMLLVAAIAAPAIAEEAAKSTTSTSTATTTTTTTTQKQPMTSPTTQVETKMHTATTKAHKTVASMHADAKNAKTAWVDSEGLKHHLADHVKYPASREQLIESCNNMADVPAADKELFSKTLPAGTYKSAQEVMTALHVKK